MTVSLRAVHLSAVGPGAALAFYRDRLGVTLRASYHAIPGAATFWKTCGVATALAGQRSTLRWNCGELKAARSARADSVVEGWGECTVPTPQERLIAERLQFTNQFRLAC